MSRKKSEPDEIIERLLNLLSDYIRDLKSVKDISFDALKSDIKTQRFVERTLQLAIESCLDIGNHIISERRFREPLDNRDIFKVLNENGIISNGMLNSLEKMASFRNILVHNYTKIDLEIVYGILKKRLTDFEKFIVSIIKYQKIN